MSQLRSEKVGRNKVKQQLCFKPNFIFQLLRITGLYSQSDRSTKKKINYSQKPQTRKIYRSQNRTKTLFYFENKIIYSGNVAKNRCTRNRKDQPAVFSIHWPYGCYRRLNLKYSTCMCGDKNGLNYIISRQLDSLLQGFVCLDYFRILSFKDTNSRSIKVS